jgi:diadenylate cyclase
MSTIGSFLLELTAYLKIVFEIGILAFLLYSALLFVRGTRAVTVMAGIATVIITMSFLSQLLGLEVIDWILAKMWTILTIAVLIIFQPEIRRAFAEIGRQQSRLRLHSNTKRDIELISALLDATFYLADRRIGALVAIEQSIGMRAYAETGTPINAPVTSKLISTIFFPNTPLHDGGVIISGDTLIAAGCIFPLTQSTDLSKSLGTRHRAGVGLTEETDAVVIIVSEESGAVSLARRGRLTRGVDKERLRRHLTNYLIKRNISRRRRRDLARPADSTALTPSADTEAEEAAEL